MARRIAKKNQLASLIQSVLSEAAEDVEYINGSMQITNLDNDNIKAQMAFQALVIAERRRKGYRSVQASIVASMIRERNSIWLAFPPTDDYPTGFGSLREFLSAAGLSHTTVGDLCRLEYIVPYCDENKIPIDEHMSEDRYPMLVEAGSTLRKAAIHGDLDTVISVLEDVSVASSRDAIRAKYAQHRDRLGQGAVHILDNRRAVIVLLLDDVDDVSSVAGKLFSIIGWDHLVSTTQQFAKSIRITINDPE